MSNETKHTPGPWKLFKKDGSCDLRVDGYGVICDFMVDGPNEEMDVEAIANAHLIAAAPELLEACKAANLRLLQQKSTLADSDILDLLQAAITKAKGH